MDCCGISGASDFSAASMTQYPLSCCKQAIVKTDATKCVATNFGSGADFNDVGCYDKLQDKVLEQKPLAAVILTLILLLQVTTFFYTFISKFALINYRTKLWN